jgi:hypothetical protein
MRYSKIIFKYTHKNMWICMGKKSPSGTSARNLKGKNPREKNIRKTHETHELVFIEFCIPRRKASRFFAHANRARFHECARARSQFLKAPTSWEWKRGSNSSYTYIKCQESHVRLHEFAMYMTERLKLRAEESESY